MYDEILAFLNEKVPSSNVSMIKPEEGSLSDSSLLVDAASIYEVCESLRSYEASPFRALEVISGVDYNDYIEVCYVLGTFDPKKPRTIMVKTRLSDRENPTLKSVCDLWLAANFQERECYDMFGVKFENHPDLRRILCPDDWEGFPLRKDYVVQDSYRGMTVNPENKMNREDQDFINNQDGMKEELIKRALAKGL